MATFSTKHPKRQQTFSFKSFSEGLNLEVSALMMPNSSLSRCQNMKYAIAKEPDGSSRIVLRKRQGTTKISTSALPSAADVMACTYYKYAGKYILATASKIYYLNASLAPVEIGSSALSGVPTFTEFHNKLIVHDGGVTKALSYTGLIENEVIGTGNGADVSFTHTLAHLPVKTCTSSTNTEVFTIQITYTSGGVTKYAAGTEFVVGGPYDSYTITGDVDGVTRSYYRPDTLALVLKTSSAPDNGTSILVTYTTADGTLNMTIETLNSLFEHKVIGTGNNSTVDFTTNLSYPVKRGSLTVTYTDTTAKSITDNCVGGLFSDINSGGTNTLNYATTGLLSFRCSGAPDNTTTFYAACVRGGCLYMWGDSDNPSRLWYSAPNDEDAWGDSTSGGYLDVDVYDGYSLLGALNFFETMVLLKENSIHRLDNFPGDTAFAVIPLIPDIGSVSTKACLNDGELISFLSKEGWVGMAASERFGDIQKTADLSEKFNVMATRYANSSAYSDYCQFDKQLWLSLYDGSAYLPDIYVINFATGGQLSLYRFAFTHTCFKYVNGEMLIGGADGNLYKLVDDESTFLDNSVSYKTTTKFRSSFTDWGLPFNRKHNKQFICHAYGLGGVSANIKIYKDNNFAEISTDTVPFTGTVGESYIDPSGASYYIYDLNMYINGESSAIAMNKKFNYRRIMFEISDIEGSEGAEFTGMEFLSALLGE
jgi:hypothetical protein